jgi:aminoglycoside phosphotransferase (APT) family kinase protein
LIEALRPAVTARTERCFLHNDIHVMNIMCRRDGSLLALIDWGDAGWGDPVIELVGVPMAAVPTLLEAYESEARDLLGDRPEARVLWDKLDYALQARWNDRRLLHDLLGFIRTADDRWRRVAR